MDRERIPLSWSGGACYAGLGGLSGALWAPGRGMPDMLHYAVAAVLALAVSILLFKRKSSEPKRYLRHFDFDRRKETEVSGRQDPLAKA